MLKIVVKRFITFLMPLFLCLAAVAAQVPSEATDLAVFLDAMTADYYKPTITVGMGSFTYADTMLPTPFARWFEDELRLALTKTVNLKLFDKQVAAAMDPSIKAKYQDFFGSEVVDSLLYGKYIADGRSVLATISLTDLSTGQLIAEKNFLMPAAQLPPGARVEPTMQTLQTASSLKSLTAGTSASDPGFSLSMSSDRGTGATYGTEYIKAIASTAPFATMEPDFADLAGSAPVAITRGLSVVSTSASNRAEAMVVYEILP